MSQAPNIKLRRSLLFIPANRPDRFDKALNSGADMVCIELEDGVAYAQKEMARDNLVNFFFQPGQIACPLRNSGQDKWAGRCPWPGRSGGDNGLAAKAGCGDGSKD